MYFNVSHNMMFGQLQEGIGQMRLFKELQEDADGMMVGAGRTHAGCGPRYRCASLARWVERLSNKPQ